MEFYLKLLVFGIGITGVIFTAMGLHSKITDGNLYHETAMVIGIVMMVITHMVMLLMYI